MPPVVPRGVFVSRDGGVRGIRTALAVLMFVTHAFVAACPACCVCASDIMSCSGCGLTRAPLDLPAYVTHLDLSHNALSALESDWAVRSLDRLTALVLSRNAIGRLAPGVFAAAPRLRHLDLSSNRLTLLNASAFAGLRELEVLLLFRNQMVQVSAGAFHGLSSLQRLYLGGNKLARFPLELYGGAGAPGNLTFLDLSSNAVREVPVLSLLALSAQQQGGIYLQGNPLLCNCALFALLEHWERRQYRPLLDFSRGYPCRLNEETEGGAWLGCRAGSHGPPQNPAGGVYHAETGDWVQVPCPGIAPPLQEGAVVIWLTPSRGSPVALEPSGAVIGRLGVLPDGSLEVRGALPEDAGTYSCVAVRGRRRSPNQTLDVTLSVGEHGAKAGASGEHFNTAFTTLASCVVSIVLVLLYLYLTPCRCRGGAAGRCGGRGVLLCADPKEAELGERRGAGAGKRVAFLEPEAEPGGTCGVKAPPGKCVTEGILKNGGRALEQP